MSQHQKLLTKLLSHPKSFTFDEAETLLSYYSFYRVNKGKTSGSRVEFRSDNFPEKIILHKPHPRNYLLPYQVKQLVGELEKGGFL